MLPCPEIIKLRFNSGTFAVILSLLVCAPFLHCVPPRYHRGTGGGLGTFGNLATRADGSNCTYKNAAQQLSPLQVPPVVLAGPVATPETQILPSSVLMLKPKSRFRHMILKFTLNFSGLSFILPLLHETPTSIVQTTFRQRL